MVLFVLMHAFMAYFIDNQLFLMHLITSFTYIVYYVQ